jgi:hypothetical protein
MFRCVSDVTMGWTSCRSIFSFSGRIADQELVMRGRDSNGCGFYAARG